MDGIHAREASSATPQSLSRASTAVNAIAVLLALGAGVMLSPHPIRVVDGDTVDRWPYRHRLVGYDTPEIRRAKCHGEREAAIAAKEKLAALIDSAQRAELIKVSSKADPWGRVLSRLEINGRDVAQIAIEQGWAVAYSGRGSRRNWCAESN